MRSYQNDRSSLLIVFLFFTCLICACDTSVLSPTDGVEPAKPASPVNALSGTPDGTVYAVGHTRDHPVVLEGSGSTWTTIWSGSSEQDTTECGEIIRLYDVWCSDDGSLVGVGNLILQRQVGAGFEVVCGLRPHHSLTSVAGTASDNVFATGTGGGWSDALYRFDGSTWEFIQPGLPDDTWFQLAGVTGSGSVYFVSQSQTPRCDNLVHFDGESWNSEDPYAGLPEVVQCSGRMRVWGNSDEDLFLIAQPPLLGKGSICHKGPTGWGIEQVLEEGYPWAIIGFEDGPVLVLARSLNGSRILIKDSEVWRVHSEIAENDTRDIWGTGPDDLYVCGMNETTRKGFIFHYDGSAWAQVVDLPI